MSPGPAREEAPSAAPTAGGVRGARWYEYPALAVLVATRLAPRKSQRPLGLLGRRAYLVTCAVLAFAGYGALTVGRREAVGTGWALDQERRGLVRALPLLVVEAVVIAMSPLWVSLMVAAAAGAGIIRARRSGRARAALRERRPLRALFVGNLASRRPGAGREILDAFLDRAKEEGRSLCLEAPAVPKLVEYYERAGLRVVGPAVRDGGRDVVYMQWPPPAEA